MVDVYDTICLTLAANDSQINGRTTLQKLIYFEMAKIPEINIKPHIAYFYGPFNRQVAHGLETFVYLDILSERRFKKGYSAYEYSILERGQHVIEDLKTENKEVFEKIKNIVQICKEHWIKSHSLSFTAKVHYMLSIQDCKNGVTENDTIAMADSFGWDITEDDVKSGAKLLEKLELVKIRR